jgi:hypothetical protein
MLTAITISIAVITQSVIMLIVIILSVVEPFPPQAVNETIQVNCDPCARWKEL